MTFASEGERGFSEPTPRSSGIETSRVSEIFGRRSMSGAHTHSIHLVTDVAVTPKNFPNAALDIFDSSKNLDMYLDMLARGLTFSSILNLPLCQAYQKSADKSIQE